MTDNPDGPPYGNYTEYTEGSPYRYIAYAEKLLNDRIRLNDLGPATRENMLLEALANAVLAIAKIKGRDRA